MNKKGITMIALVITILVMIILGSAAAGTVVGLVKISRKDGYVTTSKLVRTQVDTIYTEVSYKKEGNETFNETFQRIYVPTPFSPPTTIPAGTVSIDAFYIVGRQYGMTTAEVQALTFYKVDTPETKKVLNIEDNELNFYVNFEKNLVFSMQPLKIEGAELYTLEELDIRFKVYKKNIDLSKIKIGDTIIYNPTKGVSDTSKLSYTSTPGVVDRLNPVPGNGHSNQTITAKATHNQWLVIENTNGKIKVMSKEVIQPDTPVLDDWAELGFAIATGAGYLFSEAEIHKMCSVFGYGTGADQTLVTEYVIGNTAFEEDRERNEHKKHELIGSGARSITKEDLQKMISTSLNPTFDTLNPKVNVYLPTFNSSNPDGKDNGKLSNFKNTFKQVYTADMTLKPEYSALGFSNIFKSYYWLANRGNQTTENTAYFRTYYVSNTYISGAQHARGTNTEYINVVSSRGLRPVVQLVKDVKIKETAISGQWEVIQ